MPTVLRTGGYRFFYSGDRDEPPHVHVERDNQVAKFWLNPVRLASSRGFGGVDIGRIQRVWWMSTKKSCGVDGLSTSNSQPVHEARATAVAVSDDAVTVELDDGRVVSAPLAWYPRLLHGTREERERWRLTGDGEGIHWPNLDEDIEVDQLVAGKPSGESQQSLKRWVEERQARKAQA